MIRSVRHPLYKEQGGRVGLFGQGVGSLDWGQCDEHSCEWQKRDQR